MMIANIISILTNVLAYKERERILSCPLTFWQESIIVYSLGLNNIKPETLHLQALSLDFVP